MISLVLFLSLLNFFILLYLFRASRIIGSKTVTKDQISRELSKVERLNFRQLESYLQLLQILGINQPLPATRNYAASPDLLLEICRIIYSSKPKFIVELGSGISTLIIAKQITDETRFVSIEHSKDYAKTTRLILEDHKLTNVDLRVAPIDPTTSWYEKSKLDELKEIDLLIIDGPPQSIGANARHPAIFLLDKLSKQATVLIDDTNRDSERGLATMFAERMPNHTIYFLDYEKGAALIQHNDSHLTLGEIE